MNLELSLILAICLIIIIPQFVVIGAAKLIPFIFISWLFIIMRKKNSLLINSILWGLLLSFGYTLIHELAFNGNFLESSLVTGMYVLIIYSISYYYYLPENHFKIRKIIKLIIFFVFISSLINIFGILTNPNDGKNFAGAKTDEEAIHNLVRGVASYDNIYSYALIGPILIFLYFKNRKTHSKGNKLIILTAVSTSLCVFLYSYTIAIVLYVVILLFLTLIHRKKIGILLIVTWLSLWTVSEGNEIFITFINNVHDSAVSERLMSIYSLVFTSSGLTDESSMARIQLYNQSISTFLNNPFLGVGGYFGPSTYIVPKGIGGHSEWLDLTARYGLIGLTLFLIPTIKLIQIIRKHVFNSKNNTLFIIATFYIIVLGFINTLSSNFLILSYFFIIPSVISFYFSSLERAKIDA